MKQDEIIEMAREAEFDELAFDDWTAFTHNIERFAKLVAAKERRECAKACAELGEWPCVNAIEARGEE